MKQSCLRYIVSAFAILLSVVACVLPSQAAPSIPATSPVSIETAVAGTAQAAAQQTEQASPATATVAPTDMPTPTPRISSSGTSLVTLADGSTQFIDYVAGMQMVFPSTWLVVRVGEEEYYAAWEREEAANPNFQQIFAGLQDLDPKVFRMDALDLRPEHMINGDILRIQVTFSEGNTWTLDEIKKRETENHLPLTGYKLLSSNIFETPQGIPALSMEATWQYEGRTKTGYWKNVFFKAPGGNMTVGLIVLLDHKELIMPEFDQIISSITLFTP